MQGKLFNFSQNTIDQIIGSEAKIMIPVLEKSGISITAEDIRSEVYKDQQQEILICLRKEEPLAWIRYGFRDDKIFVYSIQFTGDSISLLRGLLREAHSALNSTKASHVESVVQITNARSRAFHEKLGFEPKKTNSKAIRYAIAVEKLRIKLQELFKN